MKCPTSWLNEVEECDCEGKPHSGHQSSTHCEGVLELEGHVIICESCGESWHPKSSLSAEVVGI